jgi:hypothetical protein
MRRHAIIPTLEDYRDWLKKAEYDLDQFRKTSTVYDLVNCFLDLNALPEWIVKGTGAPQKIRSTCSKRTTLFQARNFSQTQ